MSKLLVAAISAVGLIASPIHASAYTKEQAIQALRNQVSTVSKEELAKNLTSLTHELVDTTIPLGLKALTTATKEEAEAIINTQWPQQKMHAQALATSLTEHAAGLTPWILKNIPQERFSTNLTNLIQEFKKQSQDDPQKIKLVNTMLQQTKQVLETIFIHSTDNVFGMPLAFVAALKGNNNFIAVLKAFNADISSTKVNDISIDDILEANATLPSKL